MTGVSSSLSSEHVTCLIDSNIVSEKLCPVTSLNDISIGSHQAETKINPILLDEPRLGTIRQHRGFEWPHTTPLIYLSGSINGKNCKNKMLVDGGASANFVSAEFVIRHRLITRELKQAFKIRLVDETVLSCACVIDDARVEIAGDQYRGKHQFMVLPGLRGSDVVLGRTFLKYSRSVVDHETDRIEWKQQQQVVDGYETGKRENSVQIEAQPTQVHCKTAKLEKPIEESTTAATTGPRATDHSVGSVKQRNQLDAIVSEYERKMSENAAKLPPKRAEFDHAIPLKDPASKPVKLPPIRQRPALARAMKQTIDKLLNEGLIRKSTSPYGAPAFMVEQGGKQRMVINFTKLNEQTITNATSLPHADELIARVGKAKVFSKLDLKSGFHQLRVKDEDIAKTAFTTPFGHYEWIVMPFGDKNAPASFVQLLTQSVLVDIVHDFIIVFVDDILVFSESTDEHLNDVQAVLERLADHQLFINPEKCTFMVDEVDFLGIHLKAGDEAVKVSIQDMKVKAIADWPVPSTISQLRSFLGTANFSRSFIPNYSTIAKPLTDATSGNYTSKNAKIAWSDREQHAFDSLKRALISAPALAVPDENKPFTLFTDASDFGIGATLCQFNEQHQQMQTCAYFSSKLSGAELNWTTYDKEMFALIRALENWQMYFAQSKYPINVFTDNIALLHLLKKESDLIEKQKDSISSRQARWINVLTRFKLHPQRIEGTNNVQADALSRRPDLNGGRDEVQAIRTAQANEAARQLGLEPKIAMLEAKKSEPTLSPLLQSIVNAYSSDKQCTRMLQDPKRYHVQLKQGLIVNDHDQIIVPASPAVRATILHECHDTITSGHLGTLKTASRVRKNYDWVGLIDDVSEYVRSCSSCQENKSRAMKAAGLLQPIAPPFNKGMEISIDFVGELPTTARKKNMALVITDRYTKRVWYHATKTTINAKQTAKIIFDRVVTHQGLPNVIISDRDVRFKAKLWRALWKECGTRLAMTVAFRAEANGGTETNNRVLQDMLRSFVNERRSDWDVKLPALELAYNSSINQTTGFSPFELDVGMKPRLPLDISSDVGTKSITSLDNFMSNWEETWALAHKNIRIAQIRQKVAADRSRRVEGYEVGDKAWIRRDRGTLQGSIGGVPKLGSRNEGPYEVIELHGENNVTLKLDAGDGRHPKFHVSQLRPFHERDLDRFPEIDDTPSDTQDDDEGDSDEETEAVNDTSTSTSTTSRPTRNRKPVDHGAFVKH